MDTINKYFSLSVRYAIRGIFAFAFLVAVGFLGWTSPLGLIIILVSFWLFRKAILAFGSTLFKFITQHKRAVMLVAIAFQILLLFSARLVIRRDAAVVFTGAFHYLAEDLTVNYITRNPNNLFLFLYERLFFNLFHENGLWGMMGLNMLYVNASAYIIYATAKRYGNQKIADRCFFFFTFLFLFSPFFMSMYTDVLALPLLCLQTALALALLQTNQKTQLLKNATLLGIVTGVTYFIRPTALVLIIALFMILGLNRYWKKGIIIFSLFLVSFGSIYAGGKYLESHQTEIQLLKGKGLAKSALLFVDLGLTFSGTDQADMKAGLLQYVDESERDNYNNGMFATENIIKDIKRRLNDYTPVTFGAHLVVKLGATLMDGSLGWTYFENPDDEKTPYVSPLYSYTKNNAFLKAVRRFWISSDTVEYQLSFLIRQIIWLIMIIGMIKATRFSFESNDFLLLALLGGLAFLMIFEGGKSRYLIQFIPQILLLAGRGWENNALFPKIKDLDS